MLAAVSALRNTNECQGEMESFLMQDFSSSDGNLLLECIDFDDLFVGINDSEDMLPDLDQMEYTSEILAEFSGEESSSVVTAEDIQNNKGDDEDVNNNSFEKEDLDDDNVNKYSSNKGDEILSDNKRSAPAKGRKTSSAQQKSSNNINSQGKRKLKMEKIFKIFYDLEIRASNPKVDWTPELHRRFVQAVEQLGVDKAVPSRILELMGIDCLTRHNIASHLQKYRSHRKHLQAREAEAAKWTHKRQIYSSARVAMAAGGRGGKRDVVSTPWVAPAATMGFPPPMHHQVHPHPQHHFRPLHVWGRPSMDQSLVHMWPNKPQPHSPPPTSPPAPWAPPPALTPPSDPAYWHPHLRVQNGLTPGTLCFPQPMAAMRFAAPPPPVQPHHTMYKVEPGSGVPTGQFGPYSPLDIRPSKESIDAAIGDALSKPWQPLPLGLKPPVIDSVMVELQRQGIPKIPPT